MESKPKTSRASLDEDWDRTADALSPEEGGEVQSISLKSREEMEKYVSDNYSKLSKKQIDFLLTSLRAKKFNQENP